VRRGGEPGLEHLLRWRIFVQIAPILLKVGAIRPWVIGSRARKQGSDVQSDRRLRSHEPGALIAGYAARHAIVRAQAFLALGATVISCIALVLPHPPQFDMTGLIADQLVAFSFGLFGLVMPQLVPTWLPRIGPAIATVLTTFAVYFSGDSTSGFVMYYLWVGLYAFYFPRSRAEAAFYVLFAAANYALAIALTPAPGPSAGENADVSFFVIAAGTLVTAGVLLTYLRGRMEKLVGRLTDAARTDPLTGLPNRLGLRRVLESELERARPEGRSLSLLIIDIDGFKAVNDQHGLEVGDQILERFAELIQASTRTIDTVARSGGEEFAVVLPETGRHNAYSVAEELLSSIRRQFAQPAVEVRASIGIACSPDHAEELGDLLAAGDEALHAAKTLGGDRAVIYSSEVTTTLSIATGRRSVESQAELATVLTLAEALDQRDSSTARHSQTVGRLCEMMARELGLPEDRVRRVRLAGILHDIGKIGVSDAILAKPGPLTEEERSQMRRHPELGARILASSEMDDLRSWIVAHHERPDGTGYPNGLSGDEIPIEASILAVGDAYEAMTADRVYRMGIGEEAAQEELRRHAGTQFNPVVVEALIRALKRDPIARTVERSSSPGS
jgi:diguanylate cyclase (GGDEF)-like protein/putative nucleotidyltransferase with HDIG domain